MDVTTTTRQKINLSTCQRMRPWDSGHSIFYLYESGDKETVIKVSRPDLIDKEADALAKFTEVPYIIQLIRVVNVANCCNKYWEKGLELPLIKSIPLSNSGQNEPVISPLQALKIAREVAIALMFIHQKGLVHRDIKPENILATETGAILFDFNCAGYKGHTSNEVVGTCGLAAPELGLFGYSLDSRADIFSLGGTLFELTSKQTVLKNQTCRDSQSRLQAQHADFLDRLHQSGLPAVFIELLEFLAAFDPMNRPPTAFKALLEIERTMRLLKP